MERWHNLLIAHEIPNPKLKTDRETEVRVQRYVPTTRRGSETLNRAESEVTDLPGESPKWNPGTDLQSATCYQQRVANSNTSATQKQRAETDTVYSSNSADTRKNNGRWKGIFPKRFLTGGRSPCCTRRQAG